MRKRLIPFVIAAGLVCFGLSASTVAEDTEVVYAELAVGDASGDEEHGPLAEAYAQRAAEIQAELIDGSDAEWAGEYHFGDGLGVNVTFAISPNRGFVAIWTGCLGVYGRSLGTVTESNGRLLLNHEAPNQPGGFGNFSNVLVPVRWGERLYLVGEEQLGEFVNAVNAGFGECSGYCPTHFLRRSG